MGNAVCRNTEIPDSDSLHVLPFRSINRFTPDDEFDASVAQKKGHMGSVFLADGEANHEAPNNKLANANWQIIAMTR